MSINISKNLVLQNKCKQNIKVDNCDDWNRKIGSSCDAINTNCDQYYDSYGRICEQKPYGEKGCRPKPNTTCNFENCADWGRKIGSSCDAINTNCDQYYDSYGRICEQKPYGKKGCRPKPNTTCKINKYNLNIVKLKVNIFRPEGINISPTCPYKIYTGGIIYTDKGPDVSGFGKTEYMGIIDIQNVFTSGPTIQYKLNKGKGMGSQLVGASRSDQPIFDNNQYMDEHIVYTSGWGYPGRFGIFNTYINDINIIEESDLSFMNRVKLWRNYAFLPLEIKGANYPIIDDIFIGIVGIIDLNTNEYKVIETSKYDVDGIYTLAVNCDSLYIFPPSETKVLIFNIFEIITDLFNVSLNKEICNKEPINSNIYNIFKDECNKKITYNCADWNRKIGSSCDAINTNCDQYYDSYGRICEQKPYGEKGCRPKPNTTCKIK